MQTARLNWRPIAASPGQNWWPLAASPAADRRMGIPGPRMRPLEAMFHHSPAPRSLSFSLSTNSNFSDMAVLPARRAGSIILALRLCLVSLAFLFLTSHPFTSSFTIHCYSATVKLPPKLTNLNTK